MSELYFLDLDTRNCSYAHCDEHVIEMIPKYTQYLATAHYIHNKDSRITKEAEDHVLTLNDSDVVKWVSETTSNYQWTHDLWFWLHKEYWYRYDAMHEIWEKLYNKLSHMPEGITEGNLTTPPLTVAAGYQIQGLEDDLQNTIEGYRNYYIKWTKDKNAKWGGIVENMRQPPNWIIEYAHV
tara:strand:- start:271 stop:813 length:543 start_codon:yes stop_codon:yes gene_type:complete